jgi:thiol-disulfide isomerase/thioredoxin
MKARSALRGLLAIALAATAFAAQPAELKPWTGPTAPVPVVLRDLQGREHHLADYAGKVVLLNFWATWCDPCRAEMPAMQRLQDKLAGKPFVILAVDFGENEARIGEFLKQVPVKFTILLDRETKSANAWKVRALPLSFLIDADQKVRYSVLGDVQWDSPAVEELVRKLLPQP